MDTDEHRIVEPDKLTFAELVDKQRTEDEKAQREIQTLELLTEIRDLLKTPIKAQEESDTIKL